MAYQSNYEQYLDKMHQTDNENMTEKEMKELQEAIDNSNVSAGLEETQRQMDHQTAEVQKRFYKTTINSPGPCEKSTKEKSITPKQWGKQGKSPHVCDKESLHKDCKITYQDFLEASSEPLDVVYHTPTFNLPVTRNHLYQKFNVQTRAKLLYNYYTKVDKLKAKIARRSVYMAPYPKPILPSNKSIFKSDEDNNGNFDFSPDEPPLYVSRAGRHIKRKIYTEEVEADSDPDVAYPTKKNKTDLPDNLDLKITLDNQYIPEEKNSTPITKAKKMVQKPLTLSARKPVNRAEELFDTLVQSEDKRKRQEEEMDNFKKSLPPLSDEENIIESSPVKKNEDHSDENFVRRRIVPPKRVIGRAKRVTKQDDKEIKESPPGSPVIKRQANLNKPRENKSKPKLGLQKSKGPEASTSSGQKISCPICNKEFSNSEIMDHASECGIEEEVDKEDLLTPTAEISKSVNTKPIKCELCNKNFKPSEYREHVQRCVAEAVTNL